MKEKSILFLAGLGLYLISTGVSFAGFNFLAQRDATYTQFPAGQISPGEQPKFKVDPSIPRDQVCPLNGAKYTKQEKQDWEKRRPLSVMVENSPDSRPQSGLSRADIVYEALAEGVVTRFLAIFYCNTPFENITIAPVRSARTYYIDWVSEYDALYNHVGGANRIGVNADLTDPAADALGQINRYGIKDLDQFGIGYPDCFRNPDRTGRPVATEHTMVCLSDNLYKIAENRGWTNVDSRGIPWDQNFVEWSFKDDAKEDKRGSLDKIDITFASGDNRFDVSWEYSTEGNSYKRVNGGQPHLDLENGQQLTAKNVVIQLTSLKGPIDANLHYLYTTIGNGQALIFYDGNVIKGTWRKKSRVGRTQFFDAQAREIKFNRGPIFIEVIPDINQVTY